MGQTHDERSTVPIPANITPRDVIPHRPPMLLVDEVVEFKGRTVVCRATIRDDHAFLENGMVPALVAVELFAQTAATLVCLALLELGGVNLGMGALLGTRQLSLYTDGFRVGDVLEIHCEEVFTAGATAQMQCSVRRDSELLAEGSINVMAGRPRDARDQS